MSMSLTPLAARAPLKAGEVSSHTYTGWMVPPIPIPSLLSGFDYFNGDVDNDDNDDSDDSYDSYDGDGDDNDDSDYGVLFYSLIFY